jgi:predicted enzyme related to lactoylglutathione lyase
MRAGAYTSLSPELKGDATMTQIDHHPPGAFSWVELATTDQPAAKAFYRSLFGWQANDMPMGPSEFYSMFELSGRNAAAAYTMRPEQRSQGVPPYWGLYVAVESADRAAERAAPLGGTVALAPFDVFDAGRMAVVQDPTDAFISVWQAKQHHGIGIAGVDGSLCWGELSTPDPERASAFYSGMFGWKMVKEEHDPSGYLHIVNGADHIGGIPSAAQRSPQTPAHWLPYFAASDVDAAAAKAKGLGGAVHLSPMTIEGAGRLAVLADPQGAVFAIFQAMRRAAGS